MHLWSACSTPNHVATAIGVAGGTDSVIYKGQRYFAADPTFIGADLGQSMHPNTKPQVIYASS